MAENNIKLDNMDEALALFGDYDENINLIQRQYGVVILCRGTEISISGDEDSISKAFECINSLIALIKKGERITTQNLMYIFSLIEEGGTEQVEQITHYGI